MEFQKTIVDFFFFFFDANLFHTFKIFLLADIFLQPRSWKKAINLQLSVSLGRYLARVLIYSTCFSDWYRVPPQKNKIIEDKIFFKTDRLLKIKCQEFPLISVK